jgi:hypothetical protein
MKKEKDEVSWWDCKRCVSEKSVWEFLPEQIQLNYKIEGHLVCEISLCHESYSCDEKACPFHFTPEGMLEKLIEVSKQPWATDRVVADLVRSLKVYLAAVEREKRECLEAAERDKLEERQEQEEWARRQVENEMKLGCTLNRTTRH